MVIGFAIVKLNLFKAKKISMLNKFCFLYMFYPLVLRFLAHQKVSDLNFKPFGVMAVSSLLSQVILTLIMLIPFKNRLVQYVSSYFPSIFVNYAVVGIPILASLWPDADIVIVSMISLSNDLVTVPVYLIESRIVSLINRNKMHIEKDEPTEKFSFKIILDLLKSLATSPIILGDLSDFIVAGIGRGVPEYIERILKIVADGVLGISLIAVGGFLASHSVIACSWWKFLYCIFIKFIFFPAVVTFISLAFKLTPFLGRCCILMSTLPSASSCFMMADSAGFGGGIASTMIFWTMVLFIPFLLAWSVVLDALKLFVTD